MPTSPTPEIKQDGRRLRGDRTRHTVLAQAVAIALVEGLEGLTFGRVASAAEVPKSTIQALFKDREMLQLQTLDASADAFAANLRARLPEQASATALLKALCDGWFDLAGDGSCPGTCLVTAATTEYRARPGAIHTRVAELRALWQGTLLATAQAAMLEGGLDEQVDPEQLVFEILAFETMANLGAAGSVSSSGLHLARRSVDALLERARRK
jgi:AcrR family transcriptional regulator